MADSRIDNLVKFVNSRGLVIDVCVTLGHLGDVDSAEQVQQHEEQDRYDE